ncbi:MAG: RluA family pseudouridine synthase [Ruminococcaceae bacterium]|nr:RluA family pseudouridine synthase [Oscillospiraceae bacterium]
MNILYQDDHLVIVEKPQGILSQADASGADSLPQWLQDRGLPVLPVHRLDRATGGVMVYARTGAAAAALSHMVGQHDVFRKQYWAVVAGRPEAPEGTWEDLLYHDLRHNKSFVVKRPRKGVRHASLSYHTMQTVEAEGRTYSLLSVQLHTGRTHQIRVQFASRGLPLVGDSRYGGEHHRHLALWSVSLTFPHPITGIPISAQSHPDEMAFPWNRFAR